MERLPSRQDARGLGGAGSPRKPNRGPTAHRSNPERRAAEPLGGVFIGAPVPDAQSWVVDPPAPDPKEITTTCRAMFVATAWKSVPID